MAREASLQAIRAATESEVPGVPPSLAAPRPPFLFEESLRPLNADELTRRLSQRCVSRVSQADDESLAVHFTDGSVLHVKRRRQGVAATLIPCPSPEHGSGRRQPTKRQREYLDFIKKYTLRFRIAPSEPDIQRHVLVSAPSVNQMIQGLERAGFITRQRDSHGRVVPRSIRVIDGG